MDPELKALLTETKALAKENNRMLRLMRRNALLSFIGRIVFWIIAVGLPIYFYQAYVAPLMGAFAPKDATTTPSGSWFGFPSPAELEKLINEFKKR